MDCATCGSKGGKSIGANCNPNLAGFCCCKVEVGVTRLRIGRRERNFRLVVLLIGLRRRHFMVYCGDEKTNQYFFNFNAVHIHYCDGVRFAGNVDA